MAEVTGYLHVPSFDGEASLSADYEKKVALWNQISPWEPRKLAANLLLRMTDVAQKVCMEAGKVHIRNIVGAQQISRIPRERFAPGAIGAIFQDVVKFMNFKRGDQSVDTYLMEFDVTRMEAEARMLMGGGFPDEFASVPRTRNATA